jgi:hypothetical protein
VQDDIKVTPKLTINAGLRWDVEGSPTERYTQMNRGFATATASPLAAAVRNANSADCPACANLTGGLLFAGVNGQPRSAFETDYNHVQPRIGGAYMLTQRTVLRGGFGVFYLPEWRTADRSASLRIRTSRPPSAAARTPTSRRPR